MHVERCEDSYEVFTNEVGCVAHLICRTYIVILDSLPDAARAKTVGEKVTELLKVEARRTQKEMKANPRVELVVPKVRQFTHMGRN